MLVYPNDKGFLHQLRGRVERELSDYQNEVPEGSIGQPMSASAIAEGLKEMRAALVDPYWVEVKLRDTFAEIRAADLVRRKCAVVADDRKGFLLAYDPVKEEFVLLQRTASDLVTFGVRGDAVGCFLSR